MKPLPVLHGLVWPFALLFNKLCLGQAAGCVPWHAGATVWTIILAVLQAWLHSFSGWVQSMIPDCMVSLAGLSAHAELQAGLHTE